MLYFESTTDQAWYLQETKSKTVIGADTAYYICYKI
jgi:hypothetical protein